MIEALRDALWKQFGASIDMLRNAIVLWPGLRDSKDMKFFYMTYHVLFFLEYYLTIPVNDFKPRLPYTLGDYDNLPEHALDDLLATRHYSKEELLEYLDTCREQCRRVIEALTEESVVNLRWVDENGGKTYPIVEMLLYNMRHVQHHAAQLNLLLRQEIDEAPRWVSRAKQ
jgi:hypothetical protein